MRSSNPWVTGAAGIVAGMLMVGVLAGPAGAAPRTPKFGPAIDDPARYDGASKCAPSAKPGVVAFQRMVMRAYPYTGAGSISRACSGAASSEHHEGRAWDWGVTVSNPKLKAAADEVIEWLLKEDRYGNSNALARRYGVMYIIWNKRIWGTWGGWDVYCKMRNGVCRDPDDGGVRHPHTDHVHFSFSWAGAKKKTTGYNRSMSMITDAASTNAWDGLWAAGRNGAVMANDAGYYGGKSSSFLNTPIVGLDGTSSGYGYSMLRKDGKVYGFGDAAARRRPDANARFTDIAANPAGGGYWTVTYGGRVFDFGAVKHRGDVRSEEDPSIVAMAPTPSGKGYWLTAAGGRVYNFGDAPDVGGAGGKATDVVDIEATPTGRGLWLVTSSGRVFAFGDASHEGGATDVSTTIVGMTATPSGRGYRLVSTTGRIFNFGDAGRFSD